MVSKGPKRNPYPVPDVSTEGFWDPDGPVLGKGVSQDSESWANRLETHERLFAHHTLASIRRDHRLIRPKVPEDALDFSLTAVYTHSEDTLVPKMYVPMQAESLNWPTWRVLRNELPEITSTYNALREEFAVQRMQRSKSPHSSKQSGSSKSKKAHGSSSGKSKDKSKGSTKKKIIQYKASGKSRPGPSRYNNPRETGKGRRRELADGDDVLDKDQRHLTFAARMMAIERVHPFSVKLAIDGPHSDQTNPGYSRKIDGTFYSI